MKDLMYVAPTEKAWNDFAILQGWARKKIINGITTMVYKEGFHVDAIGPITTDPGEWDITVSPPVMIRPPVVDERYHVNLRIRGEDVIDPTFVVGDMPPATLDVLWIDPLTVETPHRIWLGGMDYYEPRPEARAKR